MTKTTPSQDGALHSHDIFRVAGRQMTMAANLAKESAVECSNHFVAEPVTDLACLFRGYARSRPEVVAAWCFVAGVIIGWKLRP